MNELLNYWRRFWGLSWWIKGSSIGGAVFIVLLIIIIAVPAGDDNGAVREGEVSPSPTVKPTATPTPQVTATPTPTPTATPASTPTATATPTPTPKPTLPAFSAAECQYLSELGEQAIDVGNAFSNIGEIAGRDDFLSDEWIIDMAVQFVVIELTRDDALALDAPPSLENIHTEWLSIMDTAVQATDLMTEGIDELDASKIDTANGLILDVTLDTVELTSLIEDFGASRSGTCP